MNALYPSDLAALLSSEFCVRLTQTLLHFLWQGLLIGLVLWMIDRLMPRASSRFRYAAGVSALGLMLACIPATYFAVGFISKDAPAGVADREPDPIVAAPPTATAATDQVPLVEAPIFNIRSVEDDDAAPGGGVSRSTSVWAWETLRSLPAALAPYATLGYLLGVAIMLARLALALRSGHVLRQSATPLADPAILAMAARQAQRIGLKVVPAIAWCQRAAVPLVVGIVRPVILLPTAIASGLAPDQLESLLAHELAHLKRLDLAVNLVQRLTESLLFFHPAVWYVSRRISSERENCCDDCVLAAGWGRVEYADALVRMAEVCIAARGLIGMERAALLAASGDAPSQLKRRVLRLLKAEDHLRMGVSRGWLLAALGGVLLTLALLPLAANWKGRAEAGQPAQAQSAADEAPTPEEAPLPDVHSSLKFLASRQNDDGSFGSGEFPLDRSPALTAICGLAMLRGDVVWDPGPTKTPGFIPAKYAAHRDKAIEFLLNQQRDSGLLAGSDQPSNALMYDHAFAMWFLAEAQRIPGRTPDLTEPLAKAVALAVRAQNKEGGWRYLPKPDDADAHVTAVQLLALSAARRAKVEVPQEVIDKAIAYLNRCREEGSRGFAYQPGLKKAAYHRSAAALAALALAGADDEWLKPGLDFLVNHAGDERQFDPELYLSDGRYFAVEALRRLPGYAGHARRLHKQFRADLLRERHADGSWREPRVGAEGPTAWACLLLLAAPSPEELTRDQAARREKKRFTGKDALDRIDEVKPAWSETQESVQFGVAIVGDKTEFSTGERVPLEMFVRNVGKEGVEITLSAEFLGNVPEVKNAAGEAIPVERVVLAGSVALYREFLKPGEAFGFRHLGVGLGPNPNPGENWHPYWAEPKPGKYMLTHTHEIDVDPENELIPGKRVKFASGEVGFEVVKAAKIGARMHDEGEAKVYEPSRTLAAMEGWTIAWDVQHATQHGDGQRVARLRVFPDGRVAAWPGIGSPLVETRISREEVRSLVNWLIDEQRAGLRMLTANAVVDRKKVPITMDPLPEALWDQEGSRVAIVRDGGTYDLMAILPERSDRPPPKLLPATSGHLSAEATARLERLMDLTVAGGRETLAGHASFANEQLRRRHPATPLKITAESLRHAGFDSDGTLALFFHFGAGGPGVGFPRGEMVVRIPKDGQRFVDKAEYWTAAEEGDRWGRTIDEKRSKSEVSAAEEALEKARLSLESSQRLAKKGLLGQVQLEAAEVAVKQAEIELAKAQARLDRLQAGDKEAAVKRVEGLLDKRVAYRAADKPLIFLLSELEEAHQVQVTIDLKEVHARGHSAQTKVTIDVTDKPLREVFKAVLTAAGLNFEVTEKGIFVPAKAKPAAGKGASLQIDYDIPGAEERGRFVVEGPSGSIGPEKIGTLHVNYVNNGQSLKLEDLPAGNYQVTRYRTLRMEEAFGMSRFLDRQQFELKDGESKTLEFTRPRGKRASGKIVGIEGKGINKVLVNVCAEIADSRESLRNPETTIYDALLAKDDGSFTTEPLPPGKYTIIAEAYLPLTPQERVSTGVIRPRYVGVAKFTVPKAGEPPDVEVTLEDARPNADGAAKPTQAWGDLTVQFVYDGPRPEPKRIVINRDVAVFGREATDESLLVGDQGGLANVAMYVTSADVPVHPEARKRTAEGPAVLKVADGRTQPRILPFAVSQRLRLINDTGVGVNFKSEGQANSPFNVLVAAEGAWESSMQKAERAPSPVTDSIHPWLIAYLLPLDHPYAAVSGADGIARLANLPQGEWTFRFWHERAGYLKSADSGQREFKITIRPGENSAILRVSPEFVAEVTSADGADR